MSLLKSMLFFLAVSCGSLITLLCLWLDMSVWHDDLSEVSVTEIVQEITLLTIVVIHFVLAKRFNAFRLCNILVGGFFLAMLIRELDAVFDVISHGSWVWFALGSSLIALYSPLRKWRETLSELNMYTRTPYYGVMISGLIAILVFSRLFGMNILWSAVLQDGYARVVKNAVEEGSEMFGYMLCLAASAGYACYVRAVSTKKAA